MHLASNSLNDDAVPNDGEDDPTLLVCDTQDTNDYPEMSLESLDFHSVIVGSGGTIDLSRCTHTFLNDEPDSRMLFPSRTVMTTPNGSIYFSSSSATDHVSRIVVVLETDSLPLKRCAHFVNRTNCSPRKYSC